MKERRKSGATHSFRLTLDAARIVDNINHPMRLGGKSRKVSEAIEWYFDSQGEASVEELKASRAWWVARYDALEADIDALGGPLAIQSLIESKNVESAPSPPGWWGRLLRWFR